MSARKPLPTCSTCRFWRPTYEKLHEAHGGDLGFCLRYPPQLSPEWVSESYKTSDVYSAGSHPATIHTDWCGEHQPATVADAPPSGT